jgi:hypothetical protein
MVEREEYPGAPRGMVEEKQQDPRYGKVLLYKVYCKPEGHHDSGYEDALCDGLVYCGADPEAVIGTGEAVELPDKFLDELSKRRLERVENLPLSRKKILDAAMVVETAPEEFTPPVLINYKLVPNTNYMFSVVATTNIWFESKCFEYEYRSPDVAGTAADAKPDPPEAPFLMSDAGSVTATTITLQWTPPLTYGGNHVLTQDAWSDSLKGWKFSKTVKMWVNDDTGEKTYDDPRCRVGGIKFCTLYAKPLVSQEASEMDDNIRAWSDFEILYTGKDTTFVVGGSACPRALLPNCIYEFKLTASNKHGESEFSGGRQLRTHFDRPDGSADLDLHALPDGWQAFWDPNSEYCYYYSISTMQSQWSHPMGIGDDSGLSFKKKRFKLLHLLDLHGTSSSSRQKVSINVRRDSLFQDSCSQIMGLVDHQLHLPLSICFVGEDVSSHAHKRCLCQLCFNVLPWVLPCDFPFHCRLKGIDSGGLTDEWYLLLSREFLNPDYGLFKIHESGLYGVEDMAFRESFSIYYQFFGRILAKAIIDKRVLEVPFCKILFCYLTGIFNFVLCCSPRLVHHRHVVYITEPPTCTQEQLQA